MTSQPYLLGQDFLALLVVHLLDLVGLLAQVLQHLAVRLNIALEHLSTFEDTAAFN